MQYCVIQTLNKHAQAKVPGKLNKYGEVCICTGILASEWPALDCHRHAWKLDYVASVAQTMVHASMLTWVHAPLLWPALQLCSLLPLAWPRSPA